MRAQSWLVGWVTAALALAIFPSFTALTAHLASFGKLLAYSGPINPLKAASPLLFGYLWMERGRFSRSFWKLLLFAAAVFTVSTGIASGLCAFNTQIFREWAVIVLSFVAAGCWLALPPKKAFSVSAVFVTAIVGSLLIELASPSAINWLFRNLFDPARSTSNHPWKLIEPASGIWESGTLARLSGYVGWLFGFFLFRRQGDSPPTRRTWLLASLGMLASAFGVLATAQRAPLVGIAAGAVIFFVCLIRIQRSARSLWAGLIALVVLAGAAAAILPRELILSRVKTIVTFQTRPETAPMYSAERSAVQNTATRIRIAKFSLGIIATSPLGNACIPPETFTRSGLDYTYHSHNLFLQQFREKGWLWGSLHLLLWLVALWGAWHGLSYAHAFLCAGIVAAMTMGMFDHPWFVLNQGLMLATYLCAGLVSFFSHSKAVRQITSRSS